MKKIKEWIFLKDSWINWNTTTIMVWVHGDEYSGVDALNEIIDTLDIVTWKVYFIYANLNAIKQKVRYTEKNLNRCFVKWNKGETYEDKRAIEIMKYLDKSDFLLDVHNTISFNSSLEILITTNIEYAKYFWPKKLVSHIDNIQKWWSDWYMDKTWKKWFCLECWSINFWDREKSKFLAIESIINFLKVTWNIEWKANKYNTDKFVIYMKEMYKTKNKDFELTKNFKDFELIKAWEIIAKDWWEDVIAKNDCYILFPCTPNNIWFEAFCLWERIIIKN